MEWDAQSCLWLNHRAQRVSSARPAINSIYSEVPSSPEARKANLSNEKGKLLAKELVIRGQLSHDRSAGHLLTRGGNSVLESEPAGQQAAWARRGKYRGK